MNNWQEDQKRGGVSPLGAAVTEFLKASGLRHKLQDAAIYSAWREAIGEENAKHWIPVDFRRGELIVEVESSAQRQELMSFTGEHFRSMANRSLGSQRIRKLTFKIRV